MDAVVIRTQDFEDAKNGLKRFSQKNESELELDSVSESGGLFGLGDHKVTGAELNRRLTKIQSHLIDINKINIDTVKEFGQVYDAFEALDRDYIPAILMSIKAAEKANVEVKEAQADISKLLDNQKKTLEILKSFQKKIESYKHISDIDKLWGDFVVAQQTLAKADDLIQNTKDKANKNTQDINALNNFKNRIEKIKHINNIDELWNNFNILREQIGFVEAQTQEVLSMFSSQSNSIDVLNEFKTTIDSVDHIKDVDSIWADVQEFHISLGTLSTDLKLIHKDFELQKHTVKILLDYKSALEKFKHLKDIDNVWDGLVALNEKANEIDNELSSYKTAIDSNKQSIDALFAFKSKLDQYEHLCDIDSTWNRQNEINENLDATRNLIDVQQKRILDLEKTINEMQQNSEGQNLIFSKKLKVAYTLAGGSIGISIIELVLHLLKVM